MDILVIYGTKRKKNTYTLVQRFLKSLNTNKNDNIKEIFTNDLTDFCQGCLNCVNKGEDNCPHREKIQIWEEMILESDVLIYATPVYVYSVTASMKNFLDHFPYMWAIHRPRPSMKKKVAVIISNAAGSGTKTTNKLIYDNLTFYQIPKIYKYGINLHAADIKNISEKDSKKIEKKFVKISKSVRKNYKNREHLKQRKKQRIFSFIVKKLMRKNTWNELDYNWYKDHDWI